MKEKKYKWHKVAESVGDIGFATNSMAGLALAGKYCVWLFKLMNRLLLRLSAHMQVAGWQRVFIDVDGMLFVRCTGINSV